MRWLQLAAAAVAGLLVPGSLELAGPSWWAGAIVAFILVRWTFAVVGRTRYYYGRASAHRECGGCGRRIHRKPGDWIRHCYACGWTAGAPGIRWLTHSVPAKQCRRTVASPSVLVFAVAVAVLAGAVSVPALPAGGAVGQPGEETPQQADSSDAGARLGIDTNATEHLIRVGINETRRAEHAPPLARNANLDAAAREHARDMAERDFYAHENPDGERPWDRTGCQAGENIHRAPYAHDAYNSIDGGGEQYDATTAEGVAAYVLEGWRLSDGHRENILSPDWNHVGVGVVVDVEDEQTFAVAMFC